MCVLRSERQLLSFRDSEKNCTTYTTVPVPCSTMLYVRNSQPDCSSTDIPYFNPVSNRDTADTLREGWLTKQATTGTKATPSHIGWQAGDGILNDGLFDDLFGAIQLGMANQTLEPVRRHGPDLRPSYRKNRGQSRHVPPIMCKSNANHLPVRLVTMLF